MFSLQPWQWIVVGMVALVCVGVVGSSVGRMFGRRAVGGRATLREATAFESARVDANAPFGAVAFDAFAYRVPARLAGRVRIVVDGGRVSVAGPRVPAGVYQAWIWLQAVLLALVPAALVGAVLRWDARWLLLALGLFVAAWAIATLGAGLWPGLGEVAYIDRGRFQAVEFALEDVRAVKVGEGWADGGIDIVLLPYKRAIDALAARRAVSFYAPDDAGRDVRYALHMTSEADTSALAALLG